MLKSFAFCSLLLVMSVGWSLADTYRCRDVDGTVMFTDDPSNIPQECQADVLRDLPPVDVTPSRSYQPVPRLPDTTTDRKQHFNSLQMKAKKLVEQYVATREQIYLSGGSKGRRKARSELGVIRAQKTQLINEVGQSSLSQVERNEIKEIVASIPE